MPPRPLPLATATLLASALAGCASTPSWLTDLVGAPRDGAAALSCPAFKGWPQVSARTDQGWRERERFTAGAYRVVAAENGTPAGPWASRYLFRAEPSPPTAGPSAGAATDAGATGSRPVVLSLGSYEATTATLRRLGGLGPNARLWHLDGYLGPRHVTYGFFEAEPRYPEIRARVLAILGSGDPAEGALSSTDACTGRISLTPDPAVPAREVDRSTVHEVAAAGGRREAEAGPSSR